MGASSDMVTDRSTVTATEAEVGRQGRAGRALFVAGSPPVYSTFHHNGGAVSIVSAPTGSRGLSTTIAASSSGAYPTASPFTPTASPSAGTEGLGRPSSAPAGASVLNGSFFGRSVGFKLPTNKQSAISSARGGSGAISDSNAVNGMLALDVKEGSRVSPPRRGSTTDARSCLECPSDWTVSELAARLVSEPDGCKATECAWSPQVSGSIPPRSPAAYRHTQTGAVPERGRDHPAGTNLLDSHRMSSPGIDPSQELISVDSDWIPASASYSAVSVMSFSPSGNEVARMDLGRSSPFRGLSFDDLSIIERSPRKERLAQMLLSTRGNNVRRFSRSPLGATPLFSTNPGSLADASASEDTRSCRVCGGRRIRPCFDCNGRGQFQRIEVQNHVVGGETCRACRGTGMIDCPACARELYRKARAAAEIKLETATRDQAAPVSLPAALTSRQHEPAAATPHAMGTETALAHSVQDSLAAAATEHVVSSVSANAEWEPQTSNVAVGKLTTCTTDGHGLIPLSS
jgi:hypothetical protein